jgi:transposase
VAIIIDRMRINLAFSANTWYNVTMFIKITKSGKYKYAQLVESYRQDGATKHRVLLNLGRVDQIKNNPSFQNLARRLVELSRAQEVVNLSSISEAEIFNWGYLVYRRIWEQFGISEVLKEIAAKRKIQFDLDGACFLMAIQHLLQPRSKLGTYNGQERYLNLPEVDLNHLYRSLDILAEYKEPLEEYLFDKNRNLFNLKVDVVFFDVTTFSFESVRADGLREFGFSKDGKFKEVQVVLALLIDCEGRPIGYELFPGNTFEGNTLEPALEKLSRRFGIRRVIIVADRGLNQKLNLKRIRDKGYDYIVAARLKNMKQEIIEQVFSDGYTDISPNEEEALLYKVIDYTNLVRAGEETYQLTENLIITYSSKRAQKDKAERERLIAKAETMLQNKAKIRASYKRGGRKYLKEVGAGTDWLLDKEAISNDERFAGYYAIQTSARNLAVTDVLSAYHSLWKIEESFRIMKSTLEVRPIFHWTEPRIKGHFVICFLAFLLARTLELKLKQSGENASPEEIRKALNSLNFAKVEIEDTDYLIKTKAPKLANKILRVMRMSSPKNVIPAKEFTLI